MTGSVRLRKWAPRRVQTVRRDTEAAPLNGRERTPCGGARPSLIARSIVCTPQAAAAAQEKVSDTPLRTRPRFFPPLASPQGADHNAGMLRIPMPFPPRPRLVSPETALADALSHRVLAMVWGAVMPGQPDGHPFPFVRPHNHDLAGSPQRLIFENLSTDLPAGEAIYPFRYPRFALGSSLVVGTIREILELMRQQLLAAASSLMDCHGPVQYRDHARAARQARELYGYESGHAIECPWPEPHHPAMVERLRRQLACWDACEASRRQMAAAAGQ